MARARLYRSRILQPNAHSLAFIEIYKIYRPLHRSKFKMLANFVKRSSYFCSNVCKESLFFDNFHFAPILMKFSRNIECSRKVLRIIPEISEFLRNFPEVWQNADRTLIREVRVIRSLGRTFISPGPGGHPRHLYSPDARAIARANAGPIGLSVY